MTCTELVDLILEFVGGDLEEAQRALFEQHLCGCRDCTVSVELYQATIFVVRALPACEDPLSDALRDRLWARVQAGLVTADGEGG